MAHPQDSDIDNSIDQSYEDLFSRETAHSPHVGDESGSANSFSKGGSTNDMPGLIDSIRNKENTPAGGWKNSVTDKAADKALAAAGPMGKIARMLPASVRKKAAAPLLIAGLLFGGGSMMSLAGPSMLLQQIMEVVGAKFDTQRVLMKGVNRRLLKNATEQVSTRRVCGLKICEKMKSISKRQERLYLKNGMEITKFSTTIAGRKVPKEIKFKDETFPASELTSRMGKDPDLMKAVMRTNSWRYAFSDRMFRSIARLHTWSKKAPFGPEDDDNDRKKDIKKKQDKLKEVAETGTSGKGVTSAAVEDCSKMEGGAKSACEERKKNREKGKAVDSEVEKAKKIGEGAKPSTVKKLLSGLTVSGTIGSICAVGDMGMAVSKGVKLLRYAVLTRYALQFLTVASQIRTGDARPQDTSALGDILTRTVMTDDPVTKKPVTSLAATDGLFYRNAAFGDTGLTEVSQEFSLGWIAGISILAAIRKVTPSKSTCDFVQNPLTQIGESLGTTLVSAFSGGGGAVLVQAIKQAVTAALKGLIKGLATGFVFEKLQEWLLKAVIDLAAGAVIDENTFGERAGDALVAGSSAIMARTGSGSGGAPLTPKQAKNYNNIDMKQVRVAAAEEDRLTLSPFDTSSPYTALGSIANSLLPYYSSFGSVGNSIRAISSINLSSIANLALPVSHAEDNKTEEAYTCEDPELNDLEIGCYQTLAPTTGLPVGVLRDFNAGVPGATLDDIANRLTRHTLQFYTTPNNPSVCERNNGIMVPATALREKVRVQCADPLIDETGHLESPLSLMYQSFVARCIIRTNPIGVEEGPEGDGRDCKVNDTATWENDYDLMELEDELNYTSGEEGIRLPNQMKVDMYLWWQGMRSYCVDTYGFDNSNTDKEEGPVCQGNFHNSNDISQNSVIRLNGGAATGENEPQGVFSGNTGNSSTSGSGSSSGTSGNSGQAAPASDGAWGMPINAAPNPGAKWHMMLSKGLHKGQDFPAPLGTPVYAAHDGTVTSKWYMGECGWATVIQVSGVQNLYMGYQHADTTVNTGDTVTKGQEIGRVGKFCGTGYHLHFSIETENRVSAYAGRDTSLDPMLYLESGKAKSAMIAPPSTADRKLASTSLLLDPISIYQFTPRSKDAYVLSI